MRESGDLPFASYHQTSPNFGKSHEQNYMIPVSSTCLSLTSPLPLIPTLSILHPINSQLSSPFPPPLRYPHLAIENALQQHSLWFLCSHIGITGLLRHEDTTNLTQFLIHLVELLQGSWERNRLGCVFLIRK